MKRFLSVALAVLMILTLVSCAVSSDPSTTSDDKMNGTTGQTALPEEDSTIKIGVFEPQSGDNAIGGKQEMLGVIYANQVKPTVVIGEKTYKIKLVYSDNESSPEKATEVAKTLVDEGISAVIGSYGSDVSLAAADVFSKAGVPVVGASCTSPAVTESGKTCFTVSYLDPYQAKALASYAMKQLGIKKIYTLACLGSQHDMGLAFYFKEAFESLGGTVVSENFITGTDDFSPYLKRAAKYECQAVFAPVSLPYAKLLLEQSASVGGLTFLGAGGWDANTVARAADIASAKVYVASCYQSGTDEGFDDGIRNWFNSDVTAKANNGGDDMISAACAAGYDAYNVLYAAIQTADSFRRADILKALPKITVKGACGTVAFDSGRNAKRSSAHIKTVKSGKWETVFEQKF